MADLIAIGYPDETTNHHAVGVGATWGMFWGMLFGMLLYGGTVLKSCLSKEAEAELQDALHGEGAAA